MIKECVIHVSSDGGKFSISPHILALRPDGTPAEPFNEGIGDTEISVSAERILKGKSIKLRTDPTHPGDHEEMWVFCAADKHKFYMGRVQPGANRISLEMMENGGSVIFPRDAGHIHGFYGRIEVLRDASNQMRINTINFTINGDQDRSAHCEINHPVTIHGANNKVIRFTVKGMIGRSVIAEYEWLSPNLPRSEPLIESEPWKPLPIDYRSPAYKEAAADSAKSLGELQEALRGENGYISEYQEEYERVSKDIEPIQTKLEANHAIYKTDIRKACYALKTLAKRFGEATRVGVRRVFAVDRFLRLMEVIWDRLPEDIKGIIKDTLKSFMGG